MPLKGFHKRAELRLGLTGDSSRDEPAVPKHSFLRQTFFEFVHFFLARAHRPCILQKVHLL
jgi:hypothetical protein